jgi:NAD(P)-dependent dehydrogenase (short-subunit alcohol dehydrogenase family)
MDLKIKNKIALVTGSTAGIGFAIAKALANWLMKALKYL